MNLSAHWLGGSRVAILGRIHRTESILPVAQQKIGVGMIGFGTVGSGVAKLLSEQADLYAQRLGTVIELRRVLVRDPAKYQGNDTAGAGLLTDDSDSFFATPDMPIVIEVAGGGDDIGGYVRRALSDGKHVVTANKSLLAAHGAELFALAHQHHVSIAFEASCGGGIPIVTALQFGLMANRIDALYGILNGTCNYILTEMTQHGRSYSNALSDAQAKGYAEADPALDVSGRDAAQKLAILASLAFGVRADGDQVRCEGIDRLDLTDVRFGAELGYNIKLLGIAQRCGETSNDAISLCTQPCFIHKDAPLAQVHGSFNALSVFGHAVGHTMYMGPGAGSLPTASAVVSDLINIVSGWYPKAFAAMNLWPDAHGPANVLNPDELESRYYLRINGKDTPGVTAKVSAILGEAQISLSAILQHEPDAGQLVPMVTTTHHVCEGALRQALAKITQLDTVAGDPVCIRIVDMPQS